MTDHAAMSDEQIPGQLSLIPDDPECTDCDDSGEIECPDCNGTDENCEACEGDGYVECQSCDG